MKISEKIKNFCNKNKFYRKNHKNNQKYKIKIEQKKKYDINFKIYSF